MREKQTTCQNQLAEGDVGNTHTHSHTHTHTHTHTHLLDTSKGVAGDVPKEAAILNKSVCIVVPASHSHLHLGDDTLAAALCCWFLLPLLCASLCTVAVSLCSYSCCCGAVLCVLRGGERISMQKEKGKRKEGRSKMESNQKMSETLILLSLSLSLPLSFDLSLSLPLSFDLSLSLCLSLSLVLLLDKEGRQQ